MSKTLDAAKVAGYPYTDGGKLDVLGDEGIIPSGTKIIEENGEHDVYSFEKVDVSVPQGVMVDESYDISEGTLTKGDITLEGDIVANIPDGVTEIGNTAFLQNIVVNVVNMPNSVTTIEDGSYSSSGSLSAAFRNCEYLKQCNLSSKLSTIGDYAFYYCKKLSEIIIPSSVTRIGDGAFEGCASLTSIKLSESITSIASGMFTRCTALANITIPDRVETISNGAFAGCSSLASVVIPDSVTSIGDFAFSGCEALTDIYYTGTQAEWEAITGISGAGIPEGATIHYEYTPE